MYIHLQEIETGLFPPNTLGQTVGNINCVSTLTISRAGSLLGKNCHDEFQVAIPPYESVEEDVCRLVPVFTLDCYRFTDTHSQ